MSNTFFKFKEFTVHQDRSAMKVTTDACLFGAWVAEKIRGQNGPVLDIGAGTGLLALMLAQKNASTIDTIELETNSFEQARQNTELSPWKDRIQTREGDARTFPFPHPYNIIISNPPFYERELKGPDVARNMAHHDQGLLLPDLLSIIKTNLTEEGKFYLLLPYKRNAAIRKLLDEQNCSLISICMVRARTNHDYFRIMLEASAYTANMETAIEEIAIKEENDIYSKRFTELLEDYYLHL